jgi:hypothetical protein
LPEANEPSRRIFSMSFITALTKESSTITSIFVPDENSGTLLIVPLPGSTDSRFVRPLPLTS